MPLRPPVSTTTLLSAGLRVVGGRHSLLLRLQLRTTSELQLHHFHSGAIPIPNPTAAAAAATTIGRITRPRCHDEKKNNKKGKVGGEARRARAMATDASATTAAAEAPAPAPAAYSTDPTPSSAPVPAPAPYRHRRVVSSFLYTGTPHTPSFRISLFKRSATLRNYPNRWAACSGSIEDTDGSPREAALRELREETGLQASWLREIGDGQEGGSGGNEGRNFELVDDELKTRWEVWPFLWRVRNMQGKGSGSGNNGAGMVEGQKQGAVHVRLVGQVEEEGERKGGESEELSVSEKKDEANALYSDSDSSAYLGVAALEALIVLDWEHTEFHFGTLEEMDSLHTVTNLRRSVESVLESVGGRGRGGGGGGGGRGGGKGSAGAVGEQRERKGE